jgi:hypothetical protein
MAAKKKKAIRRHAARQLDSTLLEAARRERVAIACMQGILASTDTDTSDVAAAKYAVACADALLDELDFGDEEEDEDDEDDEDEDEDDEGR